MSDLAIPTREVAPVCATHFGGRRGALGIGRSLAFAWLAWFSCIGSLALAATGHPGASMWGEIVIEDTYVLFKVEGAADPFQTCLDLPHLPIGPLEEDQARANREALERYVHDRLVFRIDGVEVEPTIETIYVQDGKPEEMSWKSTRVDLKYACAQPPQKLTLIWPEFKGEGVTGLSVIIRRGAKGSPRQFMVYPEEPEYTWFADSLRPRITGEVKRLSGPRKTLDVPLASLLSLLVGGAALLLASRMPRYYGIGGFLVAIALAILLKPVAHVAMPWPFALAAPLPSESQAKELFATLNKNIYRAFDAESESAIYDLLADSVDPALLDDLYGQIYESLILRDQGGAICSVDSVEDVDGKVDLAAFPDAESPSYKVEWSWRVMGAVSHWGHVHRRMNEYVADFMVRHDGESWKIAAITVKEHKRVDEFE